MIAILRIFTLLGAAQLAAAPAYAHTGAHAMFGLQSGLAHPFHGLDHLLAMFAVGLFAAQLGGRMLWLLPGSFVTMMLAGGLVGFTGFPIPAAEHLIAVSVAAIALPVAFVLGVPAWLAMGYVGLFALFHGYAHGAELPVGAETVPYMFGFAVSTALIHAGGIAAGLACARLAVLRRGHALRIAGAAVAIAGVGIVGF
jgi:urease accessory protein